MSIRSWVAGGGAALAAAGGAAAFAHTGAFDDRTDRNADGQIVGRGGLGAFELRLGDCVNRPGSLAADAGDAGQAVASVEGVPCSEAHDGQAYAVFDVTLPAFDPSAVANEAATGCLERWPDAIGTSFPDDLSHDLQTLAPTKDSWQELDDREVICFVVSFDGRPLTGSLLESGGGGT